VGGAPPLKLLVSVVDAEEALEALRGGADIIDVKNPLEGSLGACPPRIVNEVKEAVMGKAEVSAAIGDAPNLPGTISLAALGAAVSGADYVKVGVYGPKSLEDAVTLLKGVREAVKSYSDRVRVVAASYADYLRSGCLDPGKVLEAAYKAEVDVWMVDTKVKDGKTLFHFMDPGLLKSMVNKAHELGLMAAIAGSLTHREAPLICETGADVVGFRGAACEGDRVNGRVRAHLVRSLKLKIA